MNDFTIRVAPAMLVSASTDISKSADHMKSVFSEMTSMIQRTAGYWTGDAAELHRALFEEQVPKMEAIIARFVGQAERLKQISGNYTAAAQAAKTMVEELPSDVIV